MAIYHASFSIVPNITGAANYPLFDIRTSVTDSVTVTYIDIGFNDVSNSLLTLGLGLPSVLGTANPNGIKFMSDQGFQLPGISIGFDWSVLPGVPVKFIRRIFHGAGLAVDSGTTRIIPVNGFTILPGSSLGFFSLGTIGIGRPVPYHVSMEIDA